MNDDNHNKLKAFRKGTNGVSTNRVTANFMFFDRGTFWVLVLPHSGQNSDDAKSTQPKTIRHQLVQQCLGVVLGLCS